MTNSLTHLCLSPYQPTKTQVPYFVVEPESPPKHSSTPTPPISPTIPRQQRFILVWNFQGLSQPKAIRALKAMFSVHIPSILFLFESKLSSSCISLIANSIKLLSFEFIPATGTAGGLVLFWNSYIDVCVLTSNCNLISVLIFTDTFASLWQLIGVYGPPSYS